MPFDPKELGNKLIVVGERQITTGQKIKSAAQDLRVVAKTLNENQRIEQSLGSIENGTRSTRNLLTPISQTLHSIADGLSGISIPSLDVDKRTIGFPGIGEVRFVTGISVSSLRPFQVIASNIESVADKIDNIRNGLKDIADAVKDLQDGLPNVRSGILNGADDMEQGGEDLAEAGTAMKDAGALLAN